jgi:hypothetical protein
MNPGVKLALIAMLWVTGLHAEVNLIRSYRTHESSDQYVPFAVVVTPDQDVLSFVAKGDGKWRLTRLRNWLDKNPIEQTIDVPGIAVPEKPKGSRFNLALLTLTANLLVTQDGALAICVARGTESVLSIIDLRTSQILLTVHLGGSSTNSTYYVDRTGRLVLEETKIEGITAVVANQSRNSETTLKFFALPGLAPEGSCHFAEALQGRRWIPHDQDCGPSLEGLLNGLVPPRDRTLPSGPPCGWSPKKPSRDDRFWLETCQTTGAGAFALFSDTPGITARYANILSTKTGTLVGVVNETKRDTVNAQFAEHNGRDYLLIIEGGTTLKAYEIKDTRP